MEALQDLKLMVDNGNGLMNTVFKAIKSVGEGTYGMVQKYRNYITKEVVAIKEIKPNHIIMQ